MIVGNKNPNIFIHMVLFNVFLSLVSSKLLFEEEDEGLEFNARNNFDISMNQGSPFRRVNTQIIFNNEDFLQDQPSIHPNRYPTKVNPRPDNLQSTCPAYEGNFTRLDTCTQEFNNLHGNSIKSLACQPRPQIIQLKSPGPNYYLLPSVANVNRCNGFCLLSSVSCLPTKTSIKTIPVHLIDKSSVSMRMFGRQCAEVRVEEHDACSCTCKIQPSDCNDKQFYHEGSCSCICKNMDEKASCENNSHPQHVVGRSLRQNPIFYGPPSPLIEAHRKWNPSTCSCSCVVDNDDDNNNCPNDLMWIPKLCRCVRVPMTPRFGDIDDDNNENEIGSETELENNSIDLESYSRPKNIIYM